MKWPVEIGTLHSEHASLHIAIPLLGIELREICVIRRYFSTSLFITARNYNQCNCPAVVEWVVNIFQIQVRVKEESEKLAFHSENSPFKKLNPWQLATSFHGK